MGIMAHSLLWVMKDIYIYIYIYIYIINRTLRIYSGLRDQTLSGLSATLSLGERFGISWFTFKVKVKLTLY